MNRHIVLMLPLLLMLLLAGCGEYTEEEIIQFATQTAKAESRAQKAETITPAPEPYPAAQEAYPEPQEAASYPDPETEPAAVSAYPEPDEVCYQMQFAGKPGDDRAHVRYTLTLDKDSHIWITEGQTSVEATPDDMEPYDGPEPLVLMTHFSKEYPGYGTLFETGTYEIAVQGNSTLLICPFPPDRQPEPSIHIRADGTAEYIIPD